MGFAVSIFNIALHAVVMAVIVRVIQIASATHRLRPMSHLIAVMVATVSVLMAAHVSEVIVWSLAYATFDIAPSRLRSPVFCVRELHDTWVWRRYSGGALAA